MLPWYAGGIVTLLAVGVAYVAIISTLQTSLQLSVDPRFRGRVLALYFMGFTGGFPLGALIQGWLADFAGVRPVVAGAGVGLLAFAAFLATRPGLAETLDGTFISST